MKKSNCNINIILIRIHTLYGWILRRCKDILVLCKILIRKVHWRDRSKRPEICSPADFAAQTVAKQLIVHLSPSPVHLASAVVCGNDRAVSVRRRAREPARARRVFAKCLIKTFVVSRDEGFRN